MNPYFKSPGPHYSICLKMEKVMSNLQADTSHEAMCKIRDVWLLCVSCTKALEAFSGFSDNVKI